MITDSIKFKGKNDLLKSSLLCYMEKQFGAHGISNVLYQHKSCSDLNLQVADYCSWAVQRAWEMGDYRSMVLIESKVKHVGDLFKNGKMVYYEFKGRK